jgi:tRNA A37 threonylcarbamoyladenosine synthetase subunit TsaC/SUA5/YrdC
MPDNELLNDPEDIRERLSKQIDAIIDGGACAMEPTTVIDLTADEPVLVRQGRGDAAMFGL